MNTLLTVLLVTELSVVPLQNGSPSVTRVSAGDTARPVNVKLSGRARILKNVASLPVTLSNPAGSTRQAETHSDGSFEFATVPPGHYTLRAPGFIAINIVIADKDLNVELMPVYSGPGVAVSGTLKSKTPSLDRGVTRTVTLEPLEPLYSAPGITAATNPLSGSFGSPLEGALETAVRADASFEFPAVPAGIYMMRVLPAVPGVPSRRVEIADKDLRGLEITVPFQLETRGRVLLEGRDLGPNATVQSIQGNFTTATGIHEDGSFKLKLSEGENLISLTRLPSEFAVKRITFGSLDITNKPLRVDATTAAQDVVITLENVWH